MNQSELATVQAHRNVQCTFRCDAHPSHRNAQSAKATEGQPRRRLGRAIEDAQNEIKRSKSKNGGVHAIVSEPADLTVFRSYQVHWGRETLDLTELARLRWIERWQIERISAHLNYSRSGIKAALRKIEADPDRAVLEMNYRQKRPWTLATRAIRGK